MFGKTRHLALTIIGLIGFSTSIDTTASRFLDGSLEIYRTEAALKP
jgi:hypothetical protein